MTERPVDATLLPRENSLELDLAIVGGDLEEERTLRTAILLSLFSDARATPDELRRFGDPDPRGWCGDALATIEDDRFGSKLWLLARESLTAETLNRAKRYCEDALAWLIEDGIAREVAVTVTRAAMERMNIDISVTKPDDVTDRFAFVWQAA